MFNQGFGMQEPIKRTPNTKKLTLCQDQYRR